MRFQTSGFRCPARGSNGPTNLATVEDAPTPLHPYTPHLRPDTTRWGILLVPTQGKVAALQVQLTVTRARIGTVCECMRVFVGPRPRALLDLSRPTDLSLIKHTVPVFVTYLYGGRILPYK